MKLYEPEVVEMGFVEDLIQEVNPIEDLEGAGDPVRSFPVITVYSSLE